MSFKPLCVYMCNCWYVHHAVVCEWRSGGKPHCESWPSTLSEIRDSLIYYCEFQTSQPASLWGFFCLHLSYIKVASELQTWILALSFTWILWIYTQVLTIIFEAGIYPLSCHLIPVYSTCWWRFQKYMTLHLWRSHPKIWWSPLKVARFWCLEQFID